MRGVWLNVVAGKCHGAECGSYQVTSLDYVQFAKTPKDDRPDQCAVTSLL